MHPLHPSQRIAHVPTNEHEVVIEAPWMNDARRALTDNEAGADRIATPPLPSLPVMRMSKPILPQMRLAGCQRVTGDCQRVKIQHRFDNQELGEP